MSLQNKKMINYHIKNIIKQPVIKQGPTFLSFSFLIDGYISVFSLSLSKLLQILKKISLLVKNGKNFKILIELFYQTLIVSNVVLAFLDHLKPKIFFVSQPWWPT